MYDLRAIMNSAHRAYEARVYAIRANVLERNARVKKSRAAFKPAILDMGQQLASFWRSCLRHAWAEAKRAARPVAPLTERSRLIVALAYEEAAERGYRSAVASSLRAELQALAA